MADTIEIINTHIQDKDAGMDWIEAEMKRQNRDLRAMEFDHTDDDGFHHFRVVAHKKETVDKAKDTLYSS